MDRVTYRTRIKNTVLWGIFLCIGTVLRWLWIFAAHPWATTGDFREKYVYSDMLQYWLGVEKLWNPASQWSWSDTLFPPGTAYLYSLVLGSSMDRISLLQITQFAMTMAIFLLIPILATCFSGRRAALISLAIGAVSFPLFDYGAYVLSETPFTLFLLLAILILCFSLKKESLSLCLLSGLCFGLSATFKSVGLVVAVFVTVAFAYKDMHKSYCCRGFSVLTLVCGILLLLVPASMEMTRRNGGRFLLLSNDIFRVAIANHGDLRGAHAFFPDGGEFTVISPVSLQKSFTEMREIQWDTRIVFHENMAWIRAHPRKALLDFLGRSKDLIIGTASFPTGETRFQFLASISQKLIFFFIYIPAFLFIVDRRKTQSEPEKFFLWILVLPVLGLFATSIVAAMEPRYLHAFLPSLIVIASLFYERIFTKLKFMNTCLP